MEVPAGLVMGEFKACYGRGYYPILMKGIFSATPMMVQRMTNEDYSRVNSRSVGGQTDKFVP